MKSMIYTCLIVAGLVSMPVIGFQGGQGGQGGYSNSSAEMFRDFRGEVYDYRHHNSYDRYVKDAQKHPVLKEKQRQMMNRGLLKDR